MSVNPASWQFLPLSQMELGPLFSNSSPFSFSQSLFLLPLPGTEPRASLRASFGPYSVTQVRGKGKVRLELRMVICAILLTSYISLSFNSSYQSLSFLSLNLCLRPSSQSMSRERGMREGRWGSGWECCSTSGVTPAPGGPISPCMLSKKQRSTRPPVSHRYGPDSLLSSFISPFRSPSSICPSVCLVSQPPLGLCAVTLTLPSHWFEDQNSNQSHEDWDNGHSNIHPRRQVKKQERRWGRHRSRLGNRHSGNSPSMRWGEMYFIQFLSVMSVSHVMWNRLFCEWRIQYRGMFGV